MRLNGERLECDNGVVRPVLRAEIQAADGAWRAVELLVDCAADRTVLCAHVVEALKLTGSPPIETVVGVGGPVDSIIVNTVIRVIRDDGKLVLFRGAFAACRERTALDMSVLGRDILDMFALVLDRRASVVAILGGQHTYRIVAV